MSVCWLQDDVTFHYLRTYLDHTRRSSSLVWIRMQVARFYVARMCRKTSAVSQSGINTCSALELVHHQYSRRNICYCAGHCPCHSAGDGQHIWCRCRCYSQTTRRESLHLCRTPILHNCRIAHPNKVISYDGARLVAQGVHTAHVAKKALANTVNMVELVMIFR